MYGIMVNVFANRTVVVSYPDGTYSRHDLTKEGYSLFARHCNNAIHGVYPGVEATVAPLFAEPGWILLVSREREA